MTKRLWITSAVLALLVCVAARSDATAADEAKAKAEAADVANIALATDLADLGRHSKSPEMLIAAAKILRNINTVPGTDKPKVEGGTDEGGKPTRLSEVSDKLLNEAKEMAANDKVIGELIDRIAKAEKTRGTLGGPRSYFHRPGAGVTVTLVRTFAGNMPASVSVTGNGRNTLTLRVVNPGGFERIATGINPSISWVPNATKEFTITVHNDGPGAAAYTLYHN